MNDGTARTKYAEDLAIGMTVDLGTWTPGRDEIVAFARQWDPQGFHIDEEIADAGPFGGLIASGLHSLSIMSRLVVDGALKDWAVIAGRAIQDIQLTSPVRPGMELRGTLRIGDIEQRSGNRALVWLHCELRSEAAVVLSYRGATYVHSHAPAADGPAA
jgi:acyl dehydratase